MVRYMFMLIIYFASDICFSMECQKAQFFSEKITCANFDLNMLDSFLNRTFKTIDFAYKDSEIVESQKKWIKVKNKCTTLDCVASAYKDRKKY